MKRTQILETKNLIGQEVNLCGWIHNRRDHGKLVFIDLRDRSGIVQVVFTPHQAVPLTVTKKEGGLGAEQAPNDNLLYDMASQLRAEWVVRLKGAVKARPEKMFNDEISTGRIEIEPIELEILNRSETPPFPVDTDGYDIGEESRMSYRFVDLRRQRMANNLAVRHAAT
ncbi:MAG: Aspartate-tRNA ligase, partial [Candidatus Yanofskybacteria bacterium GW2011_GWC2_41_9]